MIRFDTMTHALAVTHAIAVVPTANPIWGRRQPAHTGRKSDVRGYLLRQQSRSMRSPRCDFANRGGLSCREARFGTPVPGLELRRGLVRSGFTSLVAVMKSANLRYGHDRSE